MKKNKDQFQDLEGETLRTLSHFEAMTLEKIFLDFDPTFLEKHPDLLVEDLSNVILILKKKKLVKEISDGDQKAWIKNFPKKGMLKRIKALLHW